MAANHLSKQRFWQQELIQNKRKQSSWKWEREKSKHSESKLRWWRWSREKIPGWLGYATNSLLWHTLFAFLFWVLSDCILIIWVFISCIEKALVYMSCVVYIVFLILISEGFPSFCSQCLKGLLCGLQRYKFSLYFWALIQAPHSMHAVFSWWLQHVFCLFCFVLSLSSIGLLWSV